MPTPASASATKRDRPNRPKLHDAAPFQPRIVNRVTTTDSTPVLVLFDIDGTLILSGRAGLRGMSVAFQKLYDAPNGGPGPRSLRGPNGSRDRQRRALGHPPRRRPRPRFSSCAMPISRSCPPRCRARRASRAACCRASSALLEALAGGPARCHRSGCSRGILPVAPRSNSAISISGGGSHSVRSATIISTGAICSSCDRKHRAGNTDSAGGGSRAGSGDRRRGHTARRRLRAGERRTRDRGRDRSLRLGRAAGATGANLVVGTLSATWPTYLE